MPISGPARPPAFPIIGGPPHLGLVAGGLGIDADARTAPVLERTNNFDAIVSTTTISGPSEFGSSSAIAGAEIGMKSAGGSAVALLTHSGMMQFPTRLNAAICR